MKIEKEEGRYYTIDGKKAPGITKILQVLPKDLEKWVISETLNFILQKIKPENGTILGVEEFYKILDDARFAVNNSREASKESGKIAHKFFEDYIKIKIDPLVDPLRKFPDIPTDPRAAHVVRQFLDWVDEANVKWLASELVTGSKRLGYVSIIDAVAEINGRHTIIDFKTSNAVSYDNVLQVTAGAVAYMETFGMTVPPQRMILRFPKDAEKNGYKTKSEAHCVKTMFEPDVEALENAIKMYNSLETSKLSYFFGKKKAA